MKNKKGFTLVELLAVVVIMGIVVGISIPAVTTVQKRLVKQRVNTFFRIVDEAADAYVEQYHTDFDPTRNCFEIEYKRLIDEGLLNETDITCLSEAYTGVEGKIIATRVNGGDTFKYTHYLTCYDKETNKEQVRSSEIPEGCIGVNGGFTLGVKATHIKRDGGEEPYTCANGTNCWVSGSVRYDLSSASPYYYPIKEFQYRKLGSIKWDAIDNKGEGIGDILFATSNNTDPSASSKSLDIKFRSVDTGNNISSENGYHYIRIDNTVPKVSVNNAPTTWQSGNVTVAFGTNTVPSGIKKYYVTITEGGSSRTETLNTPTYTFNNNFNGKIKVKAESNTGIVGADSEEKTILIDKVVPSVTFARTGGTTAANGWHKNVQMKLTATTGISGLKEFKYCITSGSSCDPNTSISGNTANINLTHESSTSKICAKVTSGSNLNSGIKCSEAYKIDSHPPVITVEGHTSNFTKTGFTSMPNGTATDNLGGSITVSRTGSVNAQVAGTYTVTYSATDTAGNSTQLVMTVVVRCTSGSGSQQTAHYNNRASYNGDPHTLQFTAPGAGTYTFELFGGASVGWGTTRGTGGGYLKGSINLNGGETIRVVTGSIGGWIGCFEHNGGKYVDAGSTIAYVNGTRIMEAQGGSMNINGTRRYGTGDYYHAGNVFGVSAINRHWQTTAERCPNRDKRECAAHGEAKVTYTYQICTS